MKTIYTSIFILLAFVAIGQLKIQRYEVSYMDMTYYALRDSDSGYIFKLNYDFVKVDSGSFLIAYIIDTGSPLFIADSAVKFFRTVDTTVVDRNICQPYFIYKNVKRNNDFYILPGSGENIKLILNEEVPPGIIPFIEVGVGIDKIFAPKYKMKYIGEYPIDTLDNLHVKCLSVLQEPFMFF